MHDAEYQASVRIRESVIRIRALWLRLVKL